MYHVKFQREHDMAEAKDPFEINDDEWPEEAAEGEHGRYFSFHFTIFITKLNLIDRMLNFLTAIRRGYECERNPGDQVSQRLAIERISRGCRSQFKCTVLVSEMENKDKL